MIEQRSPEWFAQRVGRVTGSAVGAILGLSPFSDADAVLRRMVREYHGAPSEFEGNVATEYGTFHEKGAIQDFEMEYQTTVTPTGFHTFEDWLGASPDGFVGKDMLIEVKCPYGLRDKEKPRFKTIEEQPYYYAQMQIQMFVTGKVSTFFWQWAPKGNHLTIVEYSPEWIAENLPKLKAFHELYLSELNNPAHLAPKARKINTLHSDKLCTEYDELSLAIENADIRKKEIVAELVALAENQDAIIGERKLTHVERKGNVDYKKVPELKGLDLEQYRGKGTSYWRLS